MFLDYVLDIHKNDLLNILADTGLFDSFSINIDFLNLFESDPNLGDSILCNPKYVIEKCDKDLIEAQKSILNDRSGSSSYLIVKENVHARFYGLPVCPELHRITIPKNQDLGCFLKLTGTAVRITQSRMLEYKRDYKCSKCNYVQTVLGIYEQRYIIKPPNKCTNPDQTCRSQTMIAVNTVVRQNCKDYQELKIQEQVNKLTVGGIPGSILVTLEDDLVDKCKPGDDVSICGIVLRRWNPVVSNKKCEVELVIKANHIEVCNAQKAIAVSVAPDVIQEFDEFWKSHRNCPMKARDVILATVCPKVYGLYMVKLALTLTVITGSNYNIDHNDTLSKSYNQNNSIVLPADEQEHSVRGQCHLLLVGDPGTGKSQLLKAGSCMLSRSVITSGSGSTKAGLTCTALREDGEWQLEAGALVLADGGACFIDELAQMREHDRASIHEAMEQQTISVAKAGIICKLNTRCAVVAACNPKGNYDTDQPLSVNVSLGTPLLSRFDLIFILLDSQNYEWDNLVADYVLFGTTTKALPKGWPLEKLQLYMSLIGPFEVKMTNEANSILRAYYVRQRNTANRDPSRTTVRMLDSLVRLTQAHAKLMYRHETLIVDAITAVSLVDLSMQDCSLADTSDALHTSFSFYPDLEYLKLAKNILTSLNLYELWHEELASFAKLLKITRQDLDNAIENNVTKYFARNVMTEESLTKETQDTVVESTYFQNHKEDKSDDSGSEAKNHETICSKVENKNIFENKSDEDWDSILSLPSTSKCKSDSSKSNNKENTAVLLAQTLKKHAGLHKKNSITNVGIITGKRKRERCKTKTADRKVVKKAKSNKEDRNGLQEVLDELNKDNKKKGKKNKVESKAGKDDLSPSSDDEIDDQTILKCLPSVNDVFSFMNFDDDGEEFAMTQIEPCVISDVGDKASSSKLEIVSDTPEWNSIGKHNREKPSSAKPENVSDKSDLNNIANHSQISPYNDDRTFKTPTASKISPVSKSTLSKLKQFSFVKTSKDAKKKLDVSDSSLDKSSSDDKSLIESDDQGDKSDSNNLAVSANITKDNARFEETNKQNSSSSFLINSKNVANKENAEESIVDVKIINKSVSVLSQKHIFESADEDYESLNFDL